MKALISSIFSFFRSTRLAVALIAGIGILSILGTLIPQGMKESYYTNRYPYAASALILLAGADHLASAPIALVPLVSFFLNLLACSTARLYRGFRYGLRQFGPDIIHLSLMLLMTGVYVSISGSSDTTFYLEEGKHGKISEGFTIAFKSSVFSAYDDGRIKEWSSTVEITSGNQLIGEYTIETNSPIKVDRGRLYQFAYKPSSKAVLISREGKILHLDEGSLFELDGEVFRYIGNETTAEVATAKFENMSGPRAINSYRQGESIASYSVEDLTTRMLTGFKYSIDPGAKIVFIAFILATIGLAETIRAKQTRKRK
ncbi:MAG: cytochrome c biogenesis protein ResB [Planctomycetota bacterium]